MTELTKQTDARDDAALDALLLESGQDNAPELKQVLRELRSFAAAEAPAPSAALQALLSPEVIAFPAGRAAGTAPAATLRARRRRSAVVSLSVVAAMGLGAGAAAAADPDFRSGAQHFISGLVQRVAPRQVQPSGQRSHGVPADARPEASRSRPAAAPAGSAPEDTSAGPTAPAHPGSAAASAAPSAAVSGQDKHVPAVPGRAAHHLPAWLTPGTPPAAEQAAGQGAGQGAGAGGKPPAPPTLPVQVGGDVLGHALPTDQGKK